MTPLVPCLVCKRHIRVDHATCPFCGGAVPETFAAGVIPAARRRLNRVALFTFALAFSGAACGQIADDGAPQPQGSQGVLPPDADGGWRDAVDAGAPMPTYGGPVIYDAEAPRDAADDDADLFDAGAPGPMYGVPRPDASPIDDDGGIEE